MKGPDEVVELEAVSKWLVPRVPNFILPASGTEEGKLPISAFSEADLRILAGAWTEVLVRRAEEMR